MIYLDTSVALAHLLGETRRPTPGFWEEEMVSSQLLEYELLARVHARGLTSSHGELVRELMQGIFLVELSGDVLERALDPLPFTLRTLDALHLATMHYLRRLGTPLTLASYDDLLITAARAMDFAIAPL